MYSPFSEASEKPRALFASDARATQSPATPTHAARQRPRKSLVFMGITSVLVHFRSRSTRPRPEAPPQGRARVLLVEDNPDAAHSFRCGGGEVVGGFFAR